MAGPELYSAQKGIIKVEETPGVKSALGPTLISMDNSETNHWKYNEHVLDKVAKINLEEGSGIPVQDCINIYQNLLEENQGKTTEELIAAFNEAMD